MSIKFSGNFNRTNRAIKKALNPTSVEVAKQSNKYVKKDTGATEASVWSDSDFDMGKVIWGTDYAAYAYYTGTPSKENNSAAEMRWAEIAKARDMEAIRKVAQNAIKENL
ncbi:MULTISPECIES: hypothetical protein [Lactococcus]|uniref:Minor capsid protein n=1 Tax=Lactococcus garvieae TaxID=1363 RepID=A0AAX3NES9_9LACT|nr:MULTISPECIES: hypothetical protein [Lactococcus]WEA14880.1 hypothetical protein PWF74_05065 [Lactococcus garvieae]